jgi:23S rRNA (guanosine2251-2'-O)-methyltransferase
LARSSKRFARNHQSAWLYGEHAVLAMLRSGRWRASELFVDDLSRLRGERPGPDLRVSVVEPGRIAELVKTDDHQGLAARMPEYPYASVDDLLAGPPSRLLILDRVQYPMNFGTMVRSAEVFGVTDVLIAAEGQCGVTAAVARMSAGSIFHVRVARAESLHEAVPRLRAAGMRVWGTSPEDGVPCDEADLRGPTAVVIGRESDGVDPALLALCDGNLTVPQSGRTQSLNAAASGAVLMYELDRQRRAAAPKSP